MRPDYPQEILMVYTKNTSWGILFLRLEGTHLHSQGGVVDSGYYTLLRAKVTLFHAPRDRKSLLEVLKRLPPCDEFLRDPVC